TAGLSEQQVAEVAVAAAGHAAGSAALAAGGTPEHVAYVAGQAAINAATTAGLNTQLLPQVIVPVFARAAGRAAAQSNGRDTAACCERAAKAATEAGEKLAFMTQEQVQEAAEAASNEASRVFAAGGESPSSGLVGMFVGTAVQHFFMSSKRPSAMAPWWLAALTPSAAVELELGETLQQGSLVGGGIEDVNHELYGGLYSQMIYGESFEEPAGSSGLSGQSLVEIPAEPGHGLTSPTWSGRNGSFAVSRNAFEG
ncbi:unnamed protein product, partial [Effrenium voratum]